MLNFSWRRWLQNSRGLLISSKRRAAKIPQPVRIEGLEERTLLTAPVAADDSGYVVNEDATLNATSVLTNDTDADTDITGAAVDTGPAHAANFSFDSVNGTFTYTPAANFRGTDSFTYHAIDSTPENSNIATVTITVGQVNDAGLFGGNTSGSGAEGTNITGTLTFADAIDGFTTPDFDVSVVATNGTASIDAATGAWTYSPNANYNGPDSFTVTVTDDDGNVETQVITLTVTQVNDAGTFGGNTSGTGAEESTITGTLTFTDAIDGFTTPDFSVSVVAAHGTAAINSATGAWTYSPVANYNGSDSFTVSVTDDDGNVETQVISLTITQLNDAGTFGGNTGGTGAEESTITGTLTFTDASDGFTTPNFSVSVVAAHGTAAINAATGAWTYTPNANYNGADSFTVSVTDDDGNVETQIVSLTVTQVNDAGTFGGNTTGTGTEDNNITGTLTFTDAADGFTTPNFTVSVVAAHGTAGINATTGEWTYSPNSNYNGADSFTVSVTDDDGNVETQVITLTVTAVNDAPVANSASFTISKNVNLQGTLTGSDVEGSSLTFSAGATTPAHGSVTVNPNGTFTYTPTANYSGPDSFTFKVNDGTANSTEATVTVTVANNLVPTAIATAFATNEDTPQSGTLSGSDGDGDTLTFFAGNVAPSHGSVVVHPNGAYTYTPAANYHGNDAFTFFVNDGTANSTEANVSITVNSVNDAPVANAGAFNVGQNLPRTGTVTGSDVDGDPLTFAAGTAAPAHGTVVVNANGTFTYTPAANYTGTDSFSFIAHDGTANSTEALITLTVVSNVLPVANAVSITTPEDTPNSGTLTGTDGDGNPLTFHAGTIAPSHGTVVINANGTFTYTPAANSHGADAFSFYVNDGFGNSQEALVSVSVTNANDAPVVSNSAVSVLKNNTLQGTLTGSDPDGDNVIFAIGSVTPSHGTVVIHPNGTFTYTPTANYSGTDSFSFMATDGSLTSTPATVTITVISNVLPVPVNGTLTTNEDTVGNGTVTATDGNGDTLTYRVGAGLPAHGTVTINPNGTFTYTPAANYNGPDSFTFIANDGTGDSAAGTITVTVTAVNDIPVANAASFSTNEDTVHTGTLTGSDVEGSSLTFSAGTVAPSHGTVTISANGSYTYTPAANYHGTDSFSFKVNDGTANSTEATVTVTVDSVNDAPVVVNGTGTVNESAVLNGTVLSLGTDADGEALTFAAVSQPSHGTLVVNANGTFAYTPTAGFSGADSFTFKANDGTVDSNTGTFTVTVTGVDDPLSLVLPGGPVTLSRNSVKVPLDSGASVTDPDTTINYSNAQITVSTLDGGNAVDDKNGRFTVSVNNQGTGAGLVKVKGTKIYFNGSTTPIASFTGGTKGQNLIITFTSAATEQAVNAVLKQISVQASKKAAAGVRTMQVKVTAQGQTDQKTKTVTIV